MNKTIITKSAKETQALGGELAGELKGGEIICLSGDLGAGKTTFTQGLLRGLGLSGSFVSPTFMIIKEYKIDKIKNQKSKCKIAIQNSKLNEIKFQKVYHIDAYRIKDKDIISLGWEEIIGSSENIVIIEWAERIKEIIPKDAMWIKFEWKDKNEREIVYKEL